jgi:group I intron endonuclease
MPDYSKGKIYKITNDLNDDVYIGSTCDTLSRRFSNHKSKSNKDPNKSPFHSSMSDIGYERFRIQLIEDYPCQDQYQLRQREAFFMRQIGTMNKFIPFVNESERKERKKKYNQTEQRKEKHREESKLFYQANKDKILEKEKEKVFCECGCEVRKKEIARHKRTQKHLDLMNGTVKK